MMQKLIAAIIMMMSLSEVTDDDKVPTIQPVITDDDNISTIQHVVTDDNTIYLPSNL